MVMIMVMVNRGRALLLKVLLNGGIVLLSRREIAGLKVGSKVLEGGSQGVGSRGGLSGRRDGLRRWLKRGEIRLRLVKIAGLEILTELLKFFFEGLEFGFQWG